MRQLSAILFTILGLVACGTPATVPEVAPGTETAPPVETKPADGTAEVKPTETAPPADGTAAPAGATKDALTASAASDFPALSSWDDAVKKAEAKFGKGVVLGETTVWYAKDGDKCTILTATKAGTMVGGAVVADGPCPTP